MTTEAPFLATILDNPADDGPRLVYADWLEEDGQAEFALTLRTAEPVVKRFGIDFNSSGGALTLSPSDLGTHSDGWEVSGEVQEDYYEWVNDFTAVNRKLGIVCGNFEVEVYATSEAAFKDFWDNHEPYAWDYMDI